MGVTVTFQQMMQVGLLLSCDIMKSDWYCQKFWRGGGGGGGGGGGKSLNLHKLRSSFSYILGTRLWATMMIQLKLGLSS